MINEHSSRDEVLVVVKEDGLALQFASEDLREDKEVVLEAVKKDGYALKYVLGNLRADKEVVLAAVKTHGLALYDALGDFKADKEVVLEAVKEDGWSLQYALGDLKADKEVVLEAVKENGWILGDAHIDLRQHPLLNSIAEETQLGKKQNISYELFCFVEKNPELYKMLVLTSKKNSKLMCDLNPLSCDFIPSLLKGDINNFVFNFASYQLNNKQLINDCSEEDNKQKLLTL